MSTSSRRILVTLSFLVLVFSIGCSPEPDLTAPVPESANKSIPIGYYDAVDGSNAATLRTSLHELIDDHTRVTYTSTALDTWDVLETADQDPNNSSRILDVYLNASYIKHGEGNTDYNREHTWPKSFGFPNDGSSNYPYTDCHHLFLCNDSYNSSRSNKPYGTAGGTGTERVTEVNDGMGGGSGLYPGWSNWYSTTYWETWMGRRGDVARALFYMDIRYEGGSHGVTGYSEPDLILTDNLTLIENSNTGSNISVAYMGLLSVMLQWHADDPVDDRERAHCDGVYAAQGNRNPFVDHPEYVDCIFGGTCGGGDTTPPETPTGFIATAGDGIVNLDWNDNSEDDLAGYTVYRAATSGGPYSSLNGTLLTVSNFADSNVTNDNTYYYLITASDNTSNESPGTAEVSSTPAGGGSGGDPVVWINEFHYDNKGGDKSEGFEVTGTAGADLSGWTLYAYNGSGGAVYDSVNLSGTFTDEQGGFGFLNFALKGMQNGAPDGLALVDDLGAVVQFISYEGTLTASDGPASGMISTNVGVSETATTPVGSSLQLAGSGAAYADFTWQSPAASTFGSVNTGQTFGGGGPVNEAPVADAAGPYAANENQSINFNSNGSYDSDGSIVSWYWDFGDGNTSTTANPAHTYSSAGVFSVTLTVTDDLGATGDDATTATITDITPPAAPVGFAAVADDGLVSLEWNANSESDLAGYTVYRTTTSGGPYSALNGGLLSSTTYDDNGVTNGTTYYYVVTASDDADNQSNNSGQVVATPEAAPIADSVVWINEFHYDNDGTDSYEFVEIAGTAGTDLSGWTVVGYNGANGESYQTESFSGTLADMEGGFGVADVTFTGMQNGGPDGLALVDGLGNVVQFLSYEGSFTAVNGPAAGMVSEDIGIAEASTTTKRYSLQLVGVGSSYADFNWVGPLRKSDGSVNKNQDLGGSI